MNLVVACLAVILLASDGLTEKVIIVKPRPNPVVVAFEKAMITPDIVPVAPMNLLRVKFPKAEVLLGNEICPPLTIDDPIFEFKVPCDSLYTILIVDPDVISLNGQDWRSFVCGLYVNVECGLDLCTGFEVSPRIAVAPVPGTGLHRYIILLYKQSRPIDTRDPYLANFRNVLFFSVVDFSEKYRLGNPIAGNFCYAQIGQRICCG